MFSSCPADLENDPEAQKVKEWRHKLQRGFLGKGPPREDVNQRMDGLTSLLTPFLASRTSLNMMESSPQWKIST